MTTRCLAASLCLLLLASPAFAVRTVVLRDTIGLDSSTSDGQPGATALTDRGGAGAIPGVIFTAFDSGTLQEARFVIFALDSLSLPVNDASRILNEAGISFHIWKDGLLGTGDTFEANPFGAPLEGAHSVVTVHNPADGTNLITVTPFGLTGPPADPSRFTTYLVEVDLSSLHIQIQAGQEYVYNIVKDTSVFNPGTLEVRQSATSLSLPFEDVWYTSNDPQISPGYLQSQRSSSYSNFASSISLLTLEGDYNSDGVVDGRDFLVWQQCVGLEGGDPYRPGDGNGDGFVTAADLTVWQQQYGMTLADLDGPISPSSAVPEPSTAVLALIGLLLACRRRRQLRQA